MRGPYTVAQMVYMFRRTGRGGLSTRHGRWLGPGRSWNRIIPRKHHSPNHLGISYMDIFIVVHLKVFVPVEDEAQFRKLAEEMSTGELPKELSDVHEIAPSTSSCKFQTWNPKPCLIDPNQEKGGTS